MQVTGRAGCSPAVQFSAREERCPHSPCDASSPHGSPSSPPHPHSSRTIKFTVTLEPVQLPASSGGPEKPQDSRGNPGAPASALDPLIGTSQGSLGHPDPSLSRDGSPTPAVGRAVDVVLCCAKVVLISLSSGCSAPLSSLAAGGSAVMTDAALQLCTLQASDESTLEILYIHL